MRLMGLLVAFAIVLGAWSAAHARAHSLTGNARFQIGNGLPLPIVLNPPPNGAVGAISGATIKQIGPHAASAPAKVVLATGQLTYPGTVGLNIPVFGSNPNVFQVFTRLSYNYPISEISLRAGGRTGASVVTFCGGEASTVTPTGNPSCAGGTAGTGLLRYTATAHQFGGAAQAGVGFPGVNGGDVAIRVASGAPCNGPPDCKAAFFNIQPASVGAGGGAFGFTNMTTPTVASPGSFFATIGALGTVNAVTTVGIGPGLTNAGTSWGGPFTTGMVTASNPSATPPEKLTLTGGDLRASGDGTGMLSLVSGGFSQRQRTGPNANRGWLNLTIGPVISHVPVMPAYGVAALVGLTALSGAYVLRRRLNR
jgi:hypothetical protein